MTFIYELDPLLGSTPDVHELPTSRVSKGLSSDRQTDTDRQRQTERHTTESINHAVGQ